MVLSDKIAVGDTVKYSRNFLRSTGLFSGPVPFAEGVVENIIPFGGRALATIRWTKELSGESNVLTVNLVRKVDLHKESS